MSYHLTHHITTYHVISLALWQTTASPAHCAGNTIAYHQASDIIYHTHASVSFHKKRESYRWLCGKNI